MANEIKGKIHAIMPTETITGKTGNNYSKRMVVLDCTRFDPNTGQKFENYPSVEFGGENNCSMLDNFKQGDMVTIEYAIKGRMYQGKDGQPKYFTTISAYKITNQQQVQSVQQPMVQQVYTPQTQSLENSEPLPF